MVSQSTADGIGHKNHSGYVDSAGNQVVDYIYDAAWMFHGGYAKVGIKMREGVIDTKGHVVIPIRYNILMQLTGTQLWEARIYPDSLYLFDCQGRTYYKGTGESALAYPDINRIIIHDPREPNGPSATLLDMEGNFICSKKPDKNEDISINAIEQSSNYKMKHCDKVMALRSKSHSALTNMNGNVVFDSIDGFGFHNGCMVLFGPKKAGAIDTNLREIVPINAGYSQVWRFEASPFFFVQKNGLWGVIDTSLNVILDCKFKNKSNQFTKELFEIYVPDSGLYLYYNFKGDLVLSSKYTTQFMFPPNRFPVPFHKNNKYQFYKNGFIGKEYDFLSSFNDEGLA